MTNISVIQLAGSMINQLERSEIKPKEKITKYSHDISKDIKHCQCTVSETDVTLFGLHCGAYTPRFCQMQLGRGYFRKP